MQEDKKPKIPPPLPGKNPQGPMVGKGVPNLPKPPAVPTRGPMPAMPGPMVSGMPKSPGMPARPFSASSMPAVSNEVEDLRMQMESRVMELQKQLQEEREKILLQTVREKEEEALSAKVEDSIKEIQERLRRDKREQELQESMSKAEAHIKELESRLATERQAWVETLKTQLTQRDSQEKEFEHDFEIRIRDLEKRWHEEKLGWSTTLRRKEEETVKLKKDTEETLKRDHEAYEKRVKQLETERDSFLREIRDINEVRTNEKENILGKLESREKEFLNVKAQQAMLVTGLRQERERVGQLRSVLEKMNAEKNSMLSSIESKEKEFFLMKTHFALYQARSKGEQERLLKEMVLMKEELRKSGQSSDIAIKSKEEEVSILKNTFEERKREFEANILKKESEYKAMIAELENKMNQKQSEFLHILSQKDKEIETRQVQYVENLRAKDKEIQGLLERERDLMINIAQNEQKARNLESRIDSLKSDLNVSRSDVDRAQNGIHLVTEKNAREIKAVTDGYEAEKLKLNGMITEKQSFIARLTEELSEKQRNNEKIEQSMELKVKDFQKEISLRDSGLLNLENFLKLKEHELANLKNEYMSGKEALISQFKMEKDALLSRIDAVKGEQQNLLREKDERIGSLTIDIREKERIFENAQKMLDEKISNLERELIARSDEYSKMMHEKETEIKKVNGEKIVEMMKVREESQKNENELNLNLSRVEKEYLKQISALGEKSNSLENALSKQKEEHRTILLKFEESWREKEGISKRLDEFKGMLDSKVQEIERLKSERRTFELESERSLELKLEKAMNGASHEKNEIMHEINALKNENQGLMRQRNEIREMLSRKEQEIDNLRSKARANELEVERDVEAKFRKLLDENKSKVQDVERELGKSKLENISIERQREEIKDVLKHRETEMENLLAKFKSKELEMQKEIDEKYKLELEKYKKQNEDISYLAAKELNLIRSSMKNEMNAIETRFDSNKRELAEKLESAGKELKIYKEQADALKVKLETEHNQRKEVVARFREESEYLIAQERDKWEAEKSNILKELEAANKSEKDWEENARKIMAQYEEAGGQVDDKISEIESLRNTIEALKQKENKVENKAERNSLFSKLWGFLNEPIIEIGSSEVNLNKKGEGK